MQVFVLRKDRLAQTCSSQGNSDSTRTFDQAHSSSSDAAAQQQLQEIESLKAEAAQVPYGPASFCSPVCGLLFFQLVFGAGLTD